MSSHGRVALLSALLFSAVSCSDTSVVAPPGLDAGDASFVAAIPGGETKLVRGPARIYQNSGVPGHPDARDEFRLDLNLPPDFDSQQEIGVYFVIRPGVSVGQMNISEPTSPEDAYVGAYLVSAAPGGWVAASGQVTVTQISAQEIAASFDITIVRVGEPASTPTGRVTGTVRAVWSRPY